MDIEQISKKYISHPKNIYAENKYVSYFHLHDFVCDVIDNGYEIYGYEFLRINDIGTQPFMEFSKWNKEGYTLDQLKEFIKELEIIITKNGFDKDEIVFGVLIGDHNQ